MQEEERSRNTSTSTSTSTSFNNTSSWSWSLSSMRHPKPSRAQSTPNLEQDQASIPIRRQHGFLAPHRARGRPFQHGDAPLLRPPGRALVVDATVGPAASVLARPGPLLVLFLVVANRGRPRPPPLEKLDRRARSPAPASVLFLCPPAFVRAGNLVLAGNGLV